MLATRNTKNDHDKLTTQNGGGGLGLLLDLVGDLNAALGHQHAAGILVLDAARVEQ